MSGQETVGGCLMSAPTGPVQSSAGVAAARSPGPIDASFAVVSALAMIVRCVKAHGTGIVHDEAITCQLFGQTFEDALTLYPFSNNHVVNSLLICLVKPLAAVHDHYIRLPALLFAGMYVLVSWRACRVFFNSPLIGLGCHAALVLAWYPLDLSFQARAYGGLLACNLGIVTLLGELAGNGGRVSTPAAVAMGALTGLSIAMLPTNLQFAGMAFAVFGAMTCLYRSKDAMAGGGRRCLTRPLGTLAIAALVAMIVPMLVYARLATPILAFYQKLDQHYVPAAEFFWQAFAWWFLHSLIAGAAATPVLGGLACGLTVLIIWSVVTDLRHRADGVAACRRVIMATVGGYLLLLVTLNYAAGMSLGFVRNRVDALVFFLLAAGLAVDHAVTVLRRPSAAAGAAELAGGCLMGVFALLLMPRMDYVYSDNVAYQSAVGRFIRRAEADDNAAEMRFRFSGRVNFCAEIVEYYALVRPSYRVAVSAPRYGTHMGVSAPEAARNWRAARTTRAANVFVSRRRDAEEPPDEAGPVETSFLANLRFDCIREVNLVPHTVRDRSGSEPLFPSRDP